MCYFDNESKLYQTDNKNVKKNICDKYQKNFNWFILDQGK